jgi:hypothetical protein
MLEEIGIDLANGLDESRVKSYIYCELNAHSVFESRAYP